MQASTISRIDTGYIPRSPMVLYHKMKKRFNCLVYHRRAGKTVGLVNDIVEEALANLLLNPHYAYAAPTYGQAKRIAWEYFKQYTKNLPKVEYRESELKITFARPAGMKKIDQNGNITTEADEITIWLLGADNPDSHRGMYFDGVVLDEYADMNPIIWTQVFRPALMDRHELSKKVRAKYGNIIREQGWASFSGTPKGENHFYDIFKAADHENWFRQVVKATQSGIISNAELEEAKRTMTDDEFNQEMECDFTAAMTGAFYSELLLKAQDAGRIGQFPYNPARPVSIFWDLGISDSMAVWFVQKKQGAYNVIDYMAGNGKGMDWWSKEIFKKGYTYAKFHFPHDGSQREISDGRTRLVKFEELGMRPAILVPRVKKKADSIQAVRRILPLCNFNQDTTAEGLSALRNYQREWDAEKKMFKDNPKHDWTSHGSDAFATFALGVHDGSFDRNSDFDRMDTEDAITEYNELGR